MDTLLIILVIYMASGILTTLAIKEVKEQSTNVMLHTRFEKYVPFVPVANTIIAILYTKAVIINVFKKDKQ